MASKAHESGSRHHESRRSSTDSRHHDNSRYHDRQPSSKSSHSKHHDSQHSSSRSNSSRHHDTPHHETQHSSRSDSSRHHVTQHSSRSNGSKHHESQHSSRSSASRYHESQHSSRLGGSKHYESQHSSRPDSSRYHESQYSSQHSSRPGGSRYHESQHSSMRHQEGQYSSRYHENQNSSRLSRSYSSVLQGSQSSSSSIKKDTGIKKNQIVLPDRFHEHALTMMSAAREPYRCSGCKEQGFGRSYRCENKGCRYVLHEECANAVLHRKNHVSHSFFEGQEFWFLEKPLGYPRVCDACRMDVRGFVYHRKATKDVYDTGLDLHPCCLKLRYKISYNDSNATKTLTLRRNVEKKCVKCKSRKVGDDIKVKGWSYLTSDGDCFHVSCFKELFLEKIRDHYFSEKKIVVSKMQSNVVESNMKVVKVGGGSSNNSKGSSLAKIVMVKIAPVVVKLIFSAIFGDPVSLVLALVEALVTSFN